MIEFFDSEVKNRYVSIYPTNMTFNKSLLQYFSDAYRVRIGIERENKLIYIFMLNKDLALSGQYKESGLLPVSTSKSYARVCSTAMIKYICGAFDLKIIDYLRYKVEYDNSKKALVIDLKEEM